MKLSQALSFFTHLLALIGFLALVSTGEVDAVSIAFFLIALAVSFADEMLGKELYLSQRTATVAAVCIIAYVFLGIAFLGTSTFSGILTLLIYLQILKLIGKKKNRDTVQIHLLSFFQFLAATVITIKLSFGVAFIAYVTVAIWTMVIFNISREAEEAANREDPRVVNPRFLGATGVVSLGIFLFTAFTFILVPRFGLGFLRADIVAPQVLSTGFGDVVKLGEVGEIKRDSTPVMTVKFLNKDFQKNLKPIYWRGIALDEFDGRSWRLSTEVKNVYSKNRLGVIQVKETGKRTVLLQEVITEPIDTSVLFAASFPIGFEGRFSAVLEDVNDSYTLSEVSYRLKYKAVSDVSFPSYEELRKEKADYPLRITQRYLQLPPLDERVYKLAQKITENEGTPYDKAKAVENYLHINMNYTLTLKKGTSEFPLEDFLFDGREGHCEYFATAMAVLLRAVGIPTRVVNGFIGGDWNEFGEFFLIRQSDAHSWVEVFFPIYGWVIFDPTPSSIGAAVSRESESLFFSYVDYLRYRWNRYIVDFSQRDQITLINKVRSGWDWNRGRLTSKLKFSFRFNKKAVLLVFIGIAAVVFVLVQPGIRGLFNNGIKIRKPNERASRLYIEALKLLSKKGFERRNFVTPREFAREVTQKGGAEFMSFWEFTEKYLALRFGEESQTELEELENLLKFFKEKAKKIN